MDTNRLLIKILEIKDPRLTSLGRLDIPKKVLRCTSSSCPLSYRCYYSFIFRISPIVSDRILCNYNHSHFVNLGKWQKFKCRIDELSDEDYFELLEGIILRYY